MRILQICNRVPYPPNDGGAIAMLNMTKAFHELGHDLYLLCINTQKHHVNPETLPELFKNLAFFKTIDANTDITPTGALFNLIFTRKSYHISRFYSPDFESQLKVVLQDHEFDIIHIEGLHMCLYIDTIRKNSKAKISLRAHNLEYLIWERMAANTLNPIKKIYLRILAARLKKFEIKTLQNIDALVPITDIDGQSFNRLTPDNTPVFVSPTGLDLAQYTIDHSKQEWPGIFHLGALNWMPNIQAVEWFIREIWPIVHKKHPELKFYIAGRNTPDSLIQQKIEGVEIVGEVENAIDFMNSKSIMVVPLLSGSGMRIKIIEGMALGKTIISTAIGAEGILYEDKVNIIIADTEIAFAEAMENCLQNPGKAQQIGEEARKLVEKEYGNLALVGKLIGFYEGLNN